MLFDQHTIYTFQGQEYIGLNTVLKDLLRLPLHHVIVGLQPSLCFYYRGMVVHQNESVLFDGLVYPDADSLGEREIDASLKHAFDFSKGLPLTGTKQHWRSTQPGYQYAKTTAGNATTRNALLGGKIVTTPSVPFLLTEWVVPYYMLSIATLLEIAPLKGWSLEPSTFKGFAREKLEKMATDRCEAIQQDAHRLNGDKFRDAISWYKKEMENTEGTLKSLQTELEQKQAELQQANALIQELQQQIAANTRASSNEAVSSPMQRKAAAKLIGALTLKAFPNQIGDKGLQSHGLITAIRNVAGVSHEAAKYWLDLAEDVLPE